MASSPNCRLNTARTAHSRCACAISTGISTAPYSVTAPLVHRSRQPRWQGKARRKAACRCAHGTARARVQATGMQQRSGAAYRAGPAVEYDRGDEGSSQKHMHGVEDADDRARRFTHAALLQRLAAKHRAQRRPQHAAQRRGGQHAAQERVVHGQQRRGEQQRLEEDNVKRRAPVAHGQHAVGKLFHARQRPQQDQASRQVCCGAPACQVCVVRVRVGIQRCEELGVVRQVAVAPLPQRCQLLPRVAECRLKVHGHVAQLRAQAGVLRALSRDGHPLQRCPRGARTWCSCWFVLLT
jgi:hypothetical protein